jgi:lysophospholipid acyltransferase (LPLAT)-like uncharacterized protein
MEELFQIQETAKQMAAKLESREIVADNAHVAQLWHCMTLLAHHVIEVNRRVAALQGKK